MPEPKVRFKRDDGSSYPAWNDVVLGDIATRVTRKNANGETDRPLTIASIEGLVDQRTYFGKTIASKDMTGYFLLKNGEYAYNKSYSAGYDYGSIKRLDKYDMGALSTLYICFALDEDQNTDFYDCYFNGLSWYNQMPQICAEGARNHGLLNVSPNDFFKIQLSVPSSKEEQQKIADFLSSVDEVITASEEEVANLETQKKAAMKKIFSQEVRFRRADGSVFPEWEEKRLDEVVEFLDGMRKPIETGDRVAGPYPYYGASGITDYVEGYIFDEDLILLSEDGANILDRNYRVCFMARGKYWVNNHAHVLRANTDCVNEYICEYLESLDYSRMNSGSAQPKINQQTCRKIPVKKPCLEEQRLIADFLSNFDEAIAAAKKELELWKTLKKGLLQQLFI